MRLLQIYHSYPELININDQYLQALGPRCEIRVVAILYGGFDAQIRAQITAEEVIFLDLPKSSSGFLSRFAVRKVLGVCRQHRPNVVIAHRYQPARLAALVSLYYSFRARLAVMHGLHQFDNWKRRLTGRLLQYCRFHMLGVSSSTAADIREKLSFYPENKIHVLHNCMHVEQTRKEIMTRAKARAALGLDDNTLVIGHVARLVRLKDQRLLLEAMATLQRQFPKIKLSLLGDGPLRGELLMQAKALQVENNVIFHGHTTDAYKYMAAFDVFALVSQHEGFGLVLLEAMCARVPIVATRAGGIPEVVAHPDELIEAGDSVALVSRITQILMEPQALRELRLSQQEEKLWQFDQEPFSRNLLEIIERAAD